MRTFIAILMTVLILLSVGCTDKAEKLTEVKIKDLNVPQDFDFETMRSVTVNLQGSFRLPVTISTETGEVLYRAMMSPTTGLNTKLTLPSAYKKVVLTYHTQVVTVKVTGNTLSYSFISSN